MARELLLAMVMETSEGHVIRALREGLKMSQTELARALDWSPSTISAWECGRTQPSRLAFKIILAFAEERGVRYRQRPAERSLVPVHAPVVMPEMDVLPPPLPRPAFPSTGLVPRERLVAVAADRPGWSAEATFRVSRPASHGESRRGAFGTAGIVAAALCAAIGLGLPGARRHATVPPHEVAARPFGSVRHAARATTRAPGAPSTVAAAGAFSGAAHVTTPPTPLARLDGLVMVGDKHRATFHTDDNSVTVDQGGQIGAQRVGSIAPDRVELIGPHGDARTVRLGHRTAIE